MSSRYQGNYVPPENIAGEQLSAMSGVRGLGITGTVLGVIAIIGLIALFVIYLDREGEDSSAGKIKKALGESTEATARFKNLDVNESTILGTNSTDDLFVNASVSSHLVPDGDKTRSLGKSSKNWDTLYIDQISFDGGVTTTSETNVLNFTGGGIGYKRKIKSLGTSSYPIISETDTGYIQLVEADGQDIYLPRATGSGNFFEFFFDTDIKNSTINTQPSDGMRGIASIASQTIGSDTTALGVSSAQFASYGVSSQSFRIFSDRPVVGSSPGAKPGSRIIFTDQSDGLWNVNANLIVDGTATGADYRSPFVYP